MEGFNAHEIQFVDINPMQNDGTCWHALYAIF